MPKILSYTPAWLSNPSLGHEIFTATAPKSTDVPTTPQKYTNGATKKAEKPGPKRTIAHRGTEIFVAVGKQVRWADLVAVKDLYDLQQDQKFRKSGRYARSEVHSDDDDVSASEAYRVWLRSTSLYKQLF